MAAGADTGGVLPMFDRARSLRRRSTPAEERLWSLLRGRKCGFRFLRQAPAGHYVLDFYCPAVRLAIEVDGDVHAKPEMQAYDEERQQVLAEELRITVLRLTNAAVLNSAPETLYKQIADEADKAISIAPSTGERPARVARP